MWEISESPSMKEVPRNKEHEFIYYKIPLVQKFSSALRLTHEKYVSSVKFHMMEEIYPKLYKHVPGELEVIHYQLQSQLKKYILKDLYELCLKWNIFSVLNSLDGIPTEQQENYRVEWKPDSPVQDVEAYIAKLHQRDKLKRMLKHMKSKNEERETVMFSNHMEILKLKKKIQHSSQTALKAMDVLNFLAFEETRFRDSKNVIKQDNV